MLSWIMALWRRPLWREHLDRLAADQAAVVEAGAMALASLDQLGDGSSAEDRAATAAEYWDLIGQPQRDRHRYRALAVLRAAEVEGRSRQ